MSALIFLVLNVTRYMRVYGGVWKYLEVYEGIYRHMKVYECIWRYMGYIGNLSLLPPPSAPSSLSPLSLPPSFPFRLASHLSSYTAGACAGTAGECAESADEPATVDNSGEEVPKQRRRQGPRQRQRHAHDRRGSPPIGIHPQRCARGPNLSAQPRMGCAPATRAARGEGLEPPQSREGMWTVRHPQLLHPHELPTLPRAMDNAWPDCRQGQLSRLVSCVS